MSRRRDFTGPSPLDEAKERLRIPELWKLRQWTGEPGKSCPCPYRPDKAASGSVFADGRLFKDFASDETLDAPALLAKVEELERVESCKLFIVLAGVRTGDGPPVPRPARPPAPPPEVAPVPPKLPPLAPLTKRDMHNLAESRHLSFSAVALACEMGLVRKCWWRGHLCYVVTDKARWVAQARRFDRGRFPSRDGVEEGPKAWTFKGGRAGWPVGIVEAVEAGAPCIALCEGSPDLIAACHFIAAQGHAGTVVPVAMLGASARIVADALPHFAGKRVRIFAHADPPKLESGQCAGTEAAFRWQSQLTAAGATVGVFDLSDLRMADGSALSDLNDLTRCHPDDWQAEAGELDTLMHF